MVVNHRITRNEWLPPSDTCVGAEEALAQWDVVTGVAAWDSALLLLPADKIAWLAPELSWLLQFSVAILFFFSDGWERHKMVREWSHRGETAPLNKCGRGVAWGDYKSRNPIRGLFPLCHVKVINPVLESGCDKALHLCLERPLLAYHKNCLLLRKVFLFQFLFSIKFKWKGVSLKIKSTF